MYSLTYEQICWGIADKDMRKNTLETIGSLDVLEKIVPNHMSIIEIQNKRNSIETKNEQL